MYTLFFIASVLFVSVLASSSYPTYNTLKNTEPSCTDKYLQYRLYVDGKLNYTYISKTPSNDTDYDKLITYFNQSHKNISLILHGLHYSGNFNPWEPILCVELSKKAANVLFVDWSCMGAQQPGPLHYGSAVGYTDEAYLASELYYRLIKKGIMNNYTIYCLGHSLGAHQCALLGRVMQKESKINMSRIIGFDPAGVSFPRGHPNAIRPEDASYVWILHSSKEPVLARLVTLGSHNKQGTFDTFINWGDSVTYDKDCGTGSLTVGNYSIPVKERTCNHGLGIIMYIRMLLGTKYRCLQPEHCHGIGLFWDTGISLDKLTVGNCATYTENGGMPTMVTSVYSQQKPTNHSHYVYKYLSIYGQEYTQYASTWCTKSVTKYNTSYIITSLIPAGIVGDSNGFLLSTTADIYLPSGFTYKYPDATSRHNRTITKQQRTTTVKTYVTSYEISGYPIT
ncbi:putative lipase-like protein [Namao virus]|nr:putative lipase-like protein [Namao virus]